MKNVSIRINVENILVLQYIADILVFLHYVHTVVYNL